MLSIENKTLQANEEALIAQDASRCEEHNAGQTSMALHFCKGACAV